MKKKLENFVVVLFLFLGIMTFSFVLWYGWDYYTLPSTDRIYLPEDKVYLEKFSSKGTVGHWYGILGFSLMILNFVYLYRKRKGKSWDRFGNLRVWMHLHVFLGIVGPLLVFFHTTFNFTNPFAAMSFISMVIVVITGIIGRFIYAAIPRSESGYEHSESALREQLAVLREKYHHSIDSEVQSEIEDILVERLRRFFVKKGDIGPVIIWKLFRLKVSTFFLRRFIERELVRKGNLSVEGARELALVSINSFTYSYYLEILERSRRILSSWRAIHRSLTFVMVITAFIHIFVATLGFGLLGGF